MRGRRALLLGIGAWDDRAIREGRSRPRLVSWGLGEDARAVATQVGGLATLRRTHPEVIQVVAHDKAQVEGLQARGVLGTLTAE